MHYYIEGGGAGELCMCGRVGGRVYVINGDPTFTYMQNTLIQLIVPSWHEHTELANNNYSVFIKEPTTAGGHAATLSAAKLKHHRGKK